MNTRSLKFQLLIWYAGVLTGCFALLGGASYFGLERWLVGSLKENQLRRARQVAELVTTRFGSNAAALAQWLLKLEAQRYSRGALQDLGTLRREFKELAWPN